MPASYPNSVKVFTTKTTGQAILASHINEPQDEITAIEQGLLQGLAHALFPNTDVGQDLGTTTKRWRQLLVQKIAAGITNATRLRVQEVGTSTWITVNADFDGTNWNREDTTQPAQGIEINNNKEVKYYRAAAGANPITWTNVFTISTDRITASQAVIGTDPGGTEVLRAQNLRAGATTITGNLTAPTAVIGTDPGGTEVLRAQNLRAGATTLTSTLTAPTVVVGTDPGGTEVARFQNMRAGETFITQNLIVKGSRPWVDVRAFGARGDGVTDDTEAIQAAINATPPGAFTFLPAGIYRISSPLILRSRGLIGEDKTDSLNGTTIKALSSFTGTAMLMSHTWTLQPAEYWHWGRVENISLDGGGVAPVGLAVYRAAEESLISRVSVYNVTDSGFWFTGDHAPATLFLCSAWYCPNYGFKFTGHPQPSNFPGNGGVVRLIGPSGDNNGVAHIYLNGAHAVTILGLKSEGHTTVIMIGGSNVGGSAASVFVTGSALRPSPASGDIVKIVDSARPIVTLFGVHQGNFQNWLNDTVLSKTVPISSLQYKINMLTWGGANVIGAGGDFLLYKEVALQGQHPSTGTQAVLLQWGTNELVSLYGRGLGLSLRDTNGVERFRVSTSGARFGGSSTFITERRTGTATVGDGGTIAHGLGGTPTFVNVQGSISGEFVSVTGLDSTNITVAIKKHDGTSGSTQTVYWVAER
jgi:hypothetical protein